MFFLPPQIYSPLLFPSPLSPRTDCIIPLYLPNLILTSPSPIYTSPSSPQAYSPLSQFHIPISLLGLYNTLFFSPQIYSPFFIHALQLVLFIRPFLFSPALSYLLSFSCSLSPRSTVHDTPLFFISPALFYRLPVFLYLPAFLSPNLFSLFQSSPYGCT